MSLLLSRRNFIRGTVGLTLALRRLHFPSRADAAAAAQSSTIDALSYRSWEDVYRQQWQWDRVAKGTHLWANCASACSWDLFIKNGIVWREEQAAVYSQTTAVQISLTPEGG